jgi:hypothetical protein
MGAGYAATQSMDYLSGIDPILAVVLGVTADVPHVFQAFPTSSTKPEQALDRTVLFCPNTSAESTNYRRTLDVASAVALVAGWRDLDLCRRSTEQGNTNVEAAPASVVHRDVPLSAPSPRKVGVRGRDSSRSPSRDGRSRNSGSRVVTACHHGRIMTICLGGNTAAKSG